MADGTSRQLDLKEKFKPQYRDEYTQELIPKDLVEEAIAEELGYFNDRVWLGVPLSEAL